MKVFVIAEIGINHNGDLSKAKDLILAAKEAGCDAVKFQKRTIDIVYSQEFLDSPRISPWGKTQREQKCGLEFGESEYAQIDKYCSELGIDWFASAWDVNSQRFLQKFPLKYNKIASAMLTNLELLRIVASERKKTFISTGMSTIEEIEMAVNIFKNFECPFELMHCNSSYPCEENDVNLKVMDTLSAKFGVAVGYSGHERDYFPTLCAVARGATSVERHITLDKSMYGSDQKASLDIKEFGDMVAQIRRIESILGTSQKVITVPELEIRKKLRH